MEKMLQYKIIKLRNKMEDGQPYGYMIVDLVWSFTDHSPLRDDGAKEIPDQVEVSEGIPAEFITSLIEQKKKTMYEALSKPGFGITVEHADVPDVLLQVLQTIAEKQ
jgi:hypothetical protein